jgi:hypothetical protein
VTDALVDKIAIAGEPHYCLDRLKEYASAGLRLPIAYQVMGRDRMSGMQLIAETFLGKSTAAGETIPDVPTSARALQRRQGEP